MKKLLTGLFLATCIGTLVSAQVFNTSSTLRPGNFRLGIEPGLYVNGLDFNLFLHGGIGITHNVDFALKLGLMGDQVYVGGDVEFQLQKWFSLAAGAHVHNHFGLDAMGILTFPLTGTVNLYTGLDADIDFPDSGIQVPVWIPLGLEIEMKRNLRFLFESEINVTSQNRHFIGGGVNFLF